MKAAITPKTKIVFLPNPNNPTGSLFSAAGLDGFLEGLTGGVLVVVDEATPRCGIASDVAALCVDRGFDLLNAPVKKVTAPHSPVPFSPALEPLFVPDAERVVRAVRELL